MNTDTSSSSKGLSFSFFSGLLNRISGLTTEFSWFASKKIESSDTESGKLMRRALLPQSWFDKLSAQWAEQPLWSKFSVFSGVALLAGVVGIFAGIPTFFALLALSLSVAVHAALVSHNTQRINHARKTIKEAVLETTGQRLDDELKEQIHDCVIHELQPPCEEIKKTSEVLKNETEMIHHLNDELTKQIGVVSQTTDELSVQGKEAIEVFHQVSEQLPSFNQTLEQTTQHATHLGAAGDELRALVHEVKKEQETYVGAMNQFSTFVDTAIKKSAQKKVRRVDESLMHAYTEETKKFDELLQTKRVRLNQAQEELCIIDEHIQERVQEIKLFDEELQKRAEQDFIEKEDHTREQLLQAHNEELKAFDVVLTERIEKNNANKEICGTDEFIQACSQKRTVFDEILKEQKIPLDREAETIRLQDEQIAMLAEDNSVLDLVPDPLMPTWLTGVDERIDERAQEIKAFDEYLNAAINKRMHSEGGEITKTPDEPNKNDTLLSTAQDALSAAQDRAKRRREEESTDGRIKARNAVGFYSSSSNFTADSSDKNVRIRAASR